MTEWAFEQAANPAVVRLHVTQELTSATILTCPPGEAPPPLDGLLEIEGVRSLDLHRYRARMNLAPGAGRAGVCRRAATILTAEWGSEAVLPIEELPRAFRVEHGTDRRVAESIEMAGDDLTLVSLFGVVGVAEAIVGRGLVLVRLGRLFRWEEVEPSVAAALSPDRTATS